MLLTVPDPEPMPWLDALPVQVAARGPRLARCFVGAEQPGILKWTTSPSPTEDQVQNMHGHSDPVRSRIQPSTTPNRYVHGTEQRRIQPRGDALLGREAAGAPPHGQGRAGRGDEVGQPGPGSQPACQRQDRAAQGTSAARAGCWVKAHTEAPVDPRMCQARAAALRWVLPRPAPLEHAEVSHPQLAPADHVGP